MYCMTLAFERDGKTERKFLDIPYDCSPILEFMYKADIALSVLVLDAGNFEIIIYRTTSDKILDERHVDTQNEIGNMITQMLRAFAKKHYSRMLPTSVRKPAERTRKQNIFQKLKLLG